MPIAGSWETQKVTGTPASAQPKETPEVHIEGVWFTDPGRERTGGSVQGGICLRRKTL